ncbi:Cytochrome P450 9e2 [Eufriesea mexicana]|uniref:Cytochrome P450 9e2 n=2 Tax=Eufriesea mexicana TaxID=516756 RepID=A0A310SNJ3_9HYME|nr:Cytochrome P450 9e2 [Eufriesea mexicana]
MLYRQFTYWKKNNVPYISGIPVFGTSWKFIFRVLSFHDYFKFVYNYYPDVRYVGTMDFFTPVLFIRDPELIKEIGVKNFDNFPDRRGFVTEEMDPIFGKNVFSLKGDRWREMRNVLSPSFTANKMRFIFELMGKCSSDFVNYLYDHPECCTMIEVKDAFTRYSNDVIATTAFGISVDSMKDRDNEFYKRGLDISSFDGVSRLVKFMLFRLNPYLTRMAGITFLSKSTSKFFCDAISKTVNARKEQGIVRPDMIHLLMQVENLKKSSSHQMHIDDIVAQAFIFFLAGFDTVSTLICYLVHELALHEDVQERLRDEVDSYLEKGDGNISYEALLEMEYMEMVISETLRLHPPTSLVDRVCAKKFELPPAAPGFRAVTVHPNQNVWFPVFGIHRDPKFFPDPEKFDPERFNSENKGTIDPYAYIPFGLGPRKCIGNRFALMETKLLIVNLLQKFVIKANEKTKRPIVYQKGNFTLIPKTGLWVTLEKRDN